MTPFKQTYSEVADLVRQFEEIEAHDLSLKVGQTFNAMKRLAATRSDAERTQLERKSHYLDAEIDKLVYQLYGLNEEIRIMDGRE
ncbi:MAG: hypothetical protein JSS75_06985 [Bacteroidetes bacterium]|nr:hypothetical protein [Bacteroidota bacterium]